MGLFELYIWSPSWVLKFWGFSTWASVATVLSTHPCVFRYLKVNPHPENYFKIQSVPIGDIAGWSLYESLWSFAAGGTFIDAKRLLFKYIPNYGFKNAQSQTRMLNSMSFFLWNKRHGNSHPLNLLVMFVYWWPASLQCVAVVVQIATAVGHGKNMVMWLYMWPSSS